MKLFDSIDKFVMDVTGTKFITEILSPDFECITELKEAHNAIIDIIKCQRGPSSHELTKYIYPLLIISSQWNTLYLKGKITPQFQEHCKRLFKKQSDFYGTGFEIDMASRAILSNWDVDFPEDYIKKPGKKPIDFIFTRNGNAYCGVGGDILGVECQSKRNTDDLEIRDIIRDIPIKAEKFKQENLGELRKIPDKKLLLFDITQNEYSKPIFLRNLKEVEKCEELKNKKLDGIIFTWSEAVKEGNKDTITVKYKSFGNIKKGYFSVTSKTCISESYYFVQKYVEPEPQWAAPGKEESYIEHTLTQQGGKLTINDLVRLTKKAPRILI